MIDETRTPTRWGYAEVKAALERFTYKPNVTFEVREDGSYNPHIGVPTLMIYVLMHTLDSTQTYPPPDTLAGARALTSRSLTLSMDLGIATTIVIDGHRFSLAPVKIGRPYIVPEHILESGCERPFYDWLSEYALADLEAHERREWAKVDGEPIRDPHLPKRLR